MTTSDDNAAKPASTGQMALRIVLMPFVVAVAVIGWLGPAVVGWNAGFVIGDSLLVWAGITALAMAGSWRPLEVTVGKRKFAIEPVTLPLTVGYLTLAPWQVGMTALIVTATGPYLWRYRVPLRMWIYTNGVWSVSGMAAAGAVQAIWPNTIPPTAILAAVLVAVIVDFVAEAVPEEVFERATTGDGYYSTQTLLLDAYDRIPAALTAAIVVPLMATPGIALAVMAALMLAAIHVARIATDGSVMRDKSEYLEDAFSRYVPSNVASEIGEHAEEIELGGEERTITVLFCDIRGFTAWSDGREPGEIVDQLNVLLTSLSDAVMLTEGTLDKYTGDGLMAFWGAPLDQADQTDRACRTALAMIDGLSQVNSLRAADRLAPFNIGIGIHTGNAVVGNIGHRNRLDYTAIGDTVNTAARLEAATKEAGATILLSDTAASNASEATMSRLEHAGDFTVKGKARPVTAFSLQHLGVVGEVVDPGRGSVNGPTSLPSPSSDEARDDLGRAA